MFKRGKGKYNSEVSIQDFYNYYRTFYTDPLPLKTYKNVFKEYIEAIMLEIIYHGYEFTLPHKLGTLYIIQRDYKIPLDKDGNIKKNSLIVDWGKTLKKWKSIYPDIDPSQYRSIKDKPYIYIDNEHSDDTVKKWRWDRRRAMLKNSSIYKLAPIRYWDRLLAKANKERNITYVSRTTII